MILSIYSVTYASYCDIDGNLYTQTKTFLDGDKARAYQQDNIRGILEDHDKSSLYDAVKDDNVFEFNVGGWNYVSKLEANDYEFYFQEKR